MDQLCVNQSNTKEGTEERSQEVPKMRQYYSNSVATLVAMDGNLINDDNKSLPSLPDTLKMIVGSK